MMQGVEGSRWVEEQGCGGMHEDEMLVPFFVLGWGKSAGRRALFVSAKLGSCLLTPYCETRIFPYL